MFKFHFVFFLLVFNAQLFFGQENNIYSKQFVYNTYQKQSFVGITGIKLLGSNEELYLEFDDLSSNFKNYNVKFFHLNMDGNTSILKPNEYLGVINDFPVTDYSISENTKVSYYHYSLLLPNFKKSGRYRADFFEFSSKKPVFSFYFYIYSGLVGINATVEPSNNTELFFSNQQVNIILNYGNIRSTNPTTDFKVIIRKNFDPNSDQKINKASYLNAGSHELKYNNFIEGNTFKAGNEYRSFDISSTFSPGGFVKEIIHNNNQDVAIIKTDNDKSPSLYFNIADFDGLYRIQTYDNSVAEINADYLNVRFALDVPEVDSKEIYVYGALTDYEIKENNKLVFNAGKNMYEAELLLKQGIYNYSYACKNKIDNSIDFNCFDRNFSETRNTYEIFVYFRPLGARADELIGYQLVKF